MDGKIEILIVMVLLAVAVTGCQAANSQPGIQPEPTDETGLTTPPNQDGALSIQNPFNPVPGDEGLIRGVAFVDSVQWNNSQNAGQVEFVFKGSLPTPCNHLRLNFLPLTADKRLDVDAYSVSNPDEVCIQVIQEFEVAVTVTGLAQGGYTLFVNGQEMLRFNIIAGEPVIPTTIAFTGIVQDILSIQNPFNPVPGDEGLVRGNAVVDSVQWNTPKNATQGELVFKGSLPTPCNQLRLNFLPLTADKRLEVDAYSVSKPDEICIQVIQEFEAVVTLTGLGQGDYTVFVNDQQMLNFNIPPGELAAHQAYAFTSIVQDILSNPGKYAGQEVVIVGYYRGWNLLGEASGQSPVTRSDWVIKDNSGAIYVSAEGEWLGGAAFVPGSLDDTTKVLRVTGVVRLTSTGQPYIEPTQVELIP